MRKVLFFTAIFSLIGAISLVSCQKENFDTEKEVDYTEAFLQTFEEKLSLVFQTAEVGLRSGNQQGFESLFKEAYMEVLGEYAFIEAFESGLREASPENRAMRTRSVEEANSEALLLEVIFASETIEEAIERFGVLAGDVSFSVEDRVKFISMREFLTFYERNSASIYTQTETVRTRSDATRCFVGMHAAYVAGGLAGCTSTGGFASIFGGKVGAAIGCGVGWIMGGITTSVLYRLHYC